jgi:hypothetical protein
VKPAPVPPAHGAPPRFPSDEHAAADQPPWKASESALDVVKVPFAVGEAAAARLTSLGLRCRTAVPSSGHMMFMVPAGADALPWPPPVTYLTGGLWPITALDASHRASHAYQTLVTPPTALWAALTALSTTSSPNRCHRPGGGEAVPEPPGGVSPGGHARQTGDGR